MKRYLRLYMVFLRFSYLNFSVYRANFINSTISTVGWGFFQLIWIHLLTIRTKSAFGWSREELIILAILYVIVIGLFHFLFTRNFDRFSRIIDRGDLDFLLLKPVDSQFIATNFIQSYPNLVRIILGVIFLISYIQLTHMKITLLGSVGFIFFIIFGIILLYSLWLFYCTLLIWFPRLTNIIDFLYTIDGMSRYPAEMMKGLSFIILIFILPFSLTIASPTKILIRGVLDGDVFGLLMLSVIMFIISRIFWKFALRHYTSASS